jgi:cell division protease FtsH
MKKMFKNAAFYLFAFLIILLIAKAFMPASQVEIKDFSLTELIQNVKADNVKTIKMVDKNKVEGTLIDGNKFVSYIPEVISDSVGNFIFDEVKENENIEFSGSAPVETSWMFDMFSIIFVVLIIGVFWFVFMQNSQGGGSKVMSFGKSKAKLVKADEGKKIKFDQVAGLKEEKEELWEVVDFLKNPKKYVELGARIPKGILLVGPPGTGKTYLTRAIAGEADVPFYNISGSDFVEMFVGVGASRVRDMFENAKKNAPCIVFIDEIDAVGRRRGAGVGGGHDEREQTLNQLLVEMDGFSDNEGIIVMAATNRPDILDPALLRPGRFDREIIVGRPDVKEREAILEVHVRNKTLSKDVDLSIVAKRTPGFTPADLENLLNEAALLTARVNGKEIDMKTIEEATTKVMVGIEKKSKVISESEKKLTAYHEGGHALLASLLPNMDPVHQVTIIPRGMAGGFTMQLAEEDQMYSTKLKMENELVVLLGGRIAEKLVIGDVSTGAQNDLSRVTSIARAMVTKYAMSDNLSSMSYSSGDDHVFLGKDMTTRRNHSEQVASEIDIEIRKIVDDAYLHAETLLKENIDKLHEIAKALLEFETITGEEFTILYEKGYEEVAKYIEEEDNKRKQKLELVKKEKEAFEKFVDVVEGNNTEKTNVDEEEKEKDEDEVKSKDMGITATKQTEE